MLSLNSLGQKQLETVKSKFYQHEDFLLELKSHQHAVGEVIHYFTKCANIIFYYLNNNKKLLEFASNFVLCHFATLLSVFVLSVCIVIVNSHQLSVSGLFQI